MKRILRRIFLSLMLLSAFSCAGQPEYDIPAAGEGETWVNLKFGWKDYDEVKVETRATLDLIPESRVSNVFVILFVGDQRYYAHYFDASSLHGSGLDLDEEAEGWQINNYTGGDSNPTNGVIRLRAPHCKGAEIYLIANIDTDMLNVSPEKLRTITTKADFMNMVARLNQKITSRNGLFPMCGTFVDQKGLPQTIDVTETGISPTGSVGAEVLIPLERLDAKVKVNIRVATDNELKKDENGVTTTQRLKEFRPESWRVVNLPTACRLVADSDSGVDSDRFSTEPVAFETVGTQNFTYVDSKTGEPKTVTSEVNGFSFYMLETYNSGNKHKSVLDETLSNLERFHLREKKNKDADGRYVSTGDIWEYAPEAAPYLEIKGEVVMQVDVSDEAKQQQLFADVMYYVHLGDIKNSYDNYDIRRNTEYTYTITIKGVNSIEAEVNTSYDDKGNPGSPDNVQEKNPGAEGMVYVAKEAIYTFDAHYGQRVFCFDAANIESDDVTWYVKTPFGREGVPDKIGDVEIPSGMDYQWVHLMLNGHAESPDYNYKYGTSVGTARLAECPFSGNNQKYPGDNSDKLMDVVQFVKYIKAQKRALDKGEPNDFRTEFDQDWFDWYNNHHKGHEVTDPEAPVDGWERAPWFRDRIYVTIFVDEFYYDADPITGNKDPQLWKRFVNQPNRMMHILCDNMKSLDGESSSTGSVVTIRQRSIQTPFSVDDPSVKTAWGCETDDESAESYLLYYPDETDNMDVNHVYSEDFYDKSSDFNGLNNTAHLWGVVDKNGDWNASKVRWDSFMDYNRPNDYVSESRGGYTLHFLKEEKAGLKYCAMMRNRDNNGNGVIDPEEIRWYTAAIGQLEYLFLAELGLNEEAKVYPRKVSGFGAEDKYSAGHPYAGAYKWKHRIVSSSLRRSSYLLNQSSYNRFLPALLWAEESVSVSSYKEWSDEIGPYGIKCIRNLGLEDPDKNDFKDDLNTRPQDIIEVTKPDYGTITPQSVYRFDCRGVNDKSRRFRTSIELEPYDENSEMARLYAGFETGPILTANFNSYPELKSMLEKGISPCPDGYRAPNIREVVAMFLLCDNRNWWDFNEAGNASRIYTSTQYSLGPLGNGKNSGTTNAPKYSWNTVSTLLGGDANINLNGNRSRFVRCVRDWDPSASD